VKADAQGNEIWSRRYESEENILSSGGGPAADGGVVVLGYILRFPVDDNDTRLFKVDADGNEVWVRTWTDGKSSGYAFTTTSDGGYLISGIQSFPEDPARSKSDALLIKVDAEGNELWSVTYGERNMIDTAHRVLETSAGDILCIGWRSADFHTWNDDLLLAAFDASGTLLWEEVSRRYAHTLYHGFAEHPDGSVVVAGSVSRAGQPFRIQLMRIEFESGGTE